MFQRVFRSKWTAAAVLMVSALHGGTAQAAADVVNCSAVSAETCQIAKSLKRGVNFGNMLDASPTEGSWGVSILPAYMDVAGANFNTVRLPVRWSNHAAATLDGKLDETFARRVDFIVDTLLSKGVYVILDFHHHQQLLGSALHPGEFSVSPAVLNARFVNIWRQIAARYKDRSPKLLFEILNEPSGRMVGDRWNAMAARVLSTIRTTNPTRSVLVGVAHTGVDRYSQIKMPADRNIIMAAHSYEPVDFTHQYGTKPLVSCCDDAQKLLIVSALNKMSDWNRVSGIPVHLGEFGSYQRAAVESRANYARFVRDQAEIRGFGWAYWEFASSFGVYPAASNNWLEPLRSALLDN